jgi:hypothetical protein
VVPRAPAPDGSDRPDAISLSRWATRWSTAVIAGWLVLAAVCAALLSGRVVTRGGSEALLPLDDRQLVDEPLVLLQLRDDAATEDPSLLLTESASAIAERLGEERVPIAAPAGEAAAWFDAHALFLVDDAALGQIGGRLGDEAISDAIENLRARMSSPLFGVSGEEPRRDPLGLLGHLEDDGGRFSSTRGPGTSTVTAAGDLLAADGTACLLQLRTTRPSDAVLADVQAAIGDRPVFAAWVGPRHVEQSARALVDDAGLRLVAIALAAIAAVLAAALRRVRATLAILVCLVTSMLFAAIALPEIDAWGLAIVILWLGFACEGALHLQRISARGWPAATVLASAMAPLWLSPYPAWQHWSWAWAVWVALAIVPLRVVLPAIHARIGGDVSWEGRGFSWRALPVLASLLALSCLVAGVVAVSSLRYRGAERVALGEYGASAAQRRLHDEFFDPAAIVRAQSEGPDPAAALERAALDARALADSIPAEIVRVDSPGLWVARTPELERRRTALLALELPARLEHMRATLEAKGFRPDAFGEFLRGAAMQDGAPTAAAMLSGSLGPWLRRYLVPGKPAAVRAFVQLSADADVGVPRIRDADGQAIALHGPAVASRRDRASFADWLGIYALCQMWIGALVVWLGTRSLTIAISAAFSTLATQCAVLAAMALLRLPVGPAMLPALLLVGASATISAGRSCRAIDLDRPLFATGIIVTSLCQVAAGVALLGSGVAMWRTMGLVVVLGATTASGIGLFVAPGICRVLRRVAGVDAGPEPEGDAQG